MTKIKFHNWYYHFFAWFLFICYEILVSFSFTNQLSTFSSYFWAYLINIILFYTNCYFVLPFALNEKRKNYFLLLIMTIVEILLCIFLKYVVSQVYIMLGMLEGHTIPSLKMFTLEGIWRSVYFIGLSTGYWFFTSTLKHVTRISTLEKIQFQNALEQQRLNENLIITENARLKSQINPHFLFNTLNFIYNDVRKSSDKGAKAILLLSEIMQYALSPTQYDDKVNLSEEISHIENFIELNQLRFRNKLVIDYKLTGNIENLRIIPLSLITIIENIFKHAELQISDKRVTIQLNIEENHMHLYIHNTKKRKSPDKSYGIGLKNTINRLETYYSQAYRLDINETETQYELNLYITL